MTEKHPSLQSLYAKLVSFSLDQDVEFRRGDSDRMRLVKSIGQRVGAIEDEDTCTVQPIYDEKTVSFGAEREPRVPKSKLALPSLFDARIELTTHIDKFPEQLEQYVDPELVVAFNMSDMNDLTLVQAVDYKIQKAYLHEDSIDIIRDRSYTLCDDRTIVYQAREDNDTPAYDRVPLAHEQRTLRVQPTVQEERVQDAADQVQYDAVFDCLFDGAQTAFYTEFLAARDQTATLAILSIIKCLGSDTRLPRLE